jgi:hypothetical protein
LMRGDKINQPGITRLFILVCIAVLFAAYGVGLGVRKIRGVDAQAPAAVAADTEKPASKPESGEDEVVADTDISPEPPEERVEESYEEPDEKVAARPERPGGSAQMVVVGSEGPRGMRERSRNMAAEERARMAAEERARKELQARRARQDEENLRRVEEAWPNLDEETRGKIRGIMERWPTMSEEERDYHRAGNID